MILKVVAPDLGGTLMQDVGMPHSWVDFYYNPRILYRNFLKWTTVKGRDISGEN